MDWPPFALAAEFYTEAETVIRNGFIAAVKYLFGVQKLIGGRQRWQIRWH
jgi:hypothetical protein